ncbi:MAG: MATE family efflux transporter, partial [Pseudomonadales bacterium]|nr:MATE family efflux transporter [Pseudomonadales bacterium]
MIQLQRAKKILWLSIPIIGGMISQNLLNLVDTAMVGQLGASALAAVGVASFAVFMSNAIVLGLSSGVQAVASRRVGEGRLSHAGVPLLSGLIIALLLGV